MTLGCRTTRARKLRPFYPRRNFLQRPPSATALGMILSMPDALIEKRSTQNMLDDLFDECTRVRARDPVIMQFHTSGRFLWRQWKGTVFSETWRSCVRNMLLSAFIGILFRCLPDFIRRSFEGFDYLWGLVLTVTTFTLSFFLNNSYALWRRCYILSRTLQGRLNDVSMILAAHATRTKSLHPLEMSEYTPESKQILTLISRYIRLLSLLAYASFTKSHRPILTPRGYRRLVERGIITPLERQALVESDVAPTQRHNAVLLWIIKVFLEGKKGGHIKGGVGMEERFLDTCHVIRAQYEAITGELQGRIPLAYAHIVQVLVDVVLWMYPLMAFASGMSLGLAVVGTGLLTIFYQGLSDLAKQFLDPYDNVQYGQGDDSLNINALIAETNAGSVRWLEGFARSPFWLSALDIKNGDLSVYSLPVNGLTAELNVPRKRRYV